jgi:hypothetical protein
LFKTLSPTILTLVQWLGGWKNIPNFEGNLEFWAKKFRDVPIHSPEDYSKLLEVSATLFSDSHLPPGSPHPPKNGVSRNWSVMFKPTRGNSTLAHDANHKEIALNLKNVNPTRDHVAGHKDVILNMEKDSNQVPPTVIPSATHAVQINSKDDEILSADI